MRDVSPDYYHEDLFRANFPLVKIIKVPPGMRMPVHDKFEGITLDREQTSLARRRWSKRLDEVSYLYTEPSNERQAFPHHMALLEGMTQFTIPRPESEVYEKLTNRLGLQDFGQTISQPSDEECYYGFSIQTSLRHVHGHDPFSRDEDTKGREDSEGGEDGEDGEGSEGGEDGEDGEAGEDGEDGEDLNPEEYSKIPTDAVVYVHDRRPLLRASKKAKTNEVVNTERVAAVLKRKFAEDESKNDAPFQGGYYAAKFAMLNIERGHGTPLYVLVMTASMWSYGILVLEGYVQLRDGKVDPESMQAFQAHQEITSIRENDLQSLQKRLEDGTKFYRKNYSENPQASYRDGPMPVGKLYVRGEWFRLPAIEPGGFGTDGATRLFDGLARLILGDSAQKMTEASFEKRVKLNNEEKLNKCFDK